MAKIIEIEIENCGRGDRQKVLNTGKYYDKTINYAGCKIQIKSGWQFFRVAGEEIKVRVLREWTK